MKFEKQIQNGMSIKAETLIYTQESQTWKMDESDVEHWADQKHTNMNPKEETLWEVFIVKEPTQRFKSQPPLI